jgi:hypothetical protein
MKFSTYLFTAFFITLFSLSSSFAANSPVFFVEIQNATGCLKTSSGYEPRGYVHDIIAYDDSGKRYPLRRGYLIPILKDGNGYHAVIDYNNAADRFRVNYTEGDRFAISDDTQGICGSDWRTRSCVIFMPINPCDK